MSIPVFVIMLCPLYQSPIVCKVHLKPNMFLVGCAVDARWQWTWGHTYNNALFVFTQQPRVIIFRTTFKSSCLMGLWILVLPHTRTVQGTSRNHELALDTHVQMILSTSCPKLKHCTCYVYSPLTSIHSTLAFHSSRWLCSIRRQVLAHSWKLIPWHSCLRKISHLTE